MISPRKRAERLQMIESPCRRVLIPRSSRESRNAGIMVFGNFGRSVIVFYECTSEHYQRNFLPALNAPPGLSLAADSPTPELVSVRGINEMVEQQRAGEHYRNSRALLLKSPDRVQVKTINSPCRHWGWMIVVNHHLIDFCCRSQADPRRRP